MTNQSQRNALHLAALYASTEVLDLLTTANLSGLNADARDRDGHTPNECFLNCRSVSCAVARKSFHVEKAAWVGLMDSLRRRTETSFEVFGNDQATKAMRHDSLVPEDASDLDRNWTSSMEGNDDSASDEEYVDAEDDMLHDAR